MKFNIYDNFLEEKNFNNIYDTLLGDNFPWFFNYQKTLGKDELNNFQFTHSFYKNEKVESPYFNLILPIIDIINPKSLIRVKANLTTVTEKKFIFSMHRDFDIDCTTAVFYVNSNNGMTVFENGSSVKSEKNRFVNFPSKNFHAGTTCTDKKVRCVININYL